MASDAVVDDGEQRRVEVEVVKSKETNIGNVMAFLPRTGSRRH